MKQVAFIMTWLAALSVYADPPARLSDEQRREAAERFDRAMALLDEGDDRGALAELARLYERTRHPQVLYNLALLYARMKRPVESVRAVDELLARPGGLTQKSLEVARRTRRDQAQKVAQLEVITNVPALIEIDGVEAGRTPMEAPLRVAAGRFVVTVSSPGHLPRHRELTVAGEATKSVHVELLPTERRMAHLAVRTPIPGADVLVDGQRVGRSPLPGTVRVQPGRRQVEVRRAGYRPARREVVLDDGTTTALELDLEEDPRAEVAGRLLLQLSEPDADVFIDGRARGSARAAWRVPAGPHLLRIERAGFLPSRSMVHVPQGGEAEVRVTLVPTAETRQAYEQRVRWRRLVGWISVAGGAALVIGAGTWWLVNEGQLDDARGAQTVAADTLAEGAPPPCGGGSDVTTPQYEQCEADLKDADGDVNLHKNLRTASLVGVGLGALATAVGAVLLATAGDPDRYDSVSSHPRRGWKLSGLFGPSGGGLQLRGSF